MKTSAIENWHQEPSKQFSASWILNVCLGRFADSTKRASHFFSILEWQEKISGWTWNSIKFMSESLAYFMKIECNKKLRGQEMLSVWLKDLLLLSTNMNKDVSQAITMSYRKSSFSYLICIKGSVIRKYRSSFLTIMHSWILTDLFMDLTNFLRWKTTNLKLLL